MNTQFTKNRMCFRLCILLAPFLHKFTRNSKQNVFSINKVFVVCYQPNFCLLDEFKWLVSLLLYHIISREFSLKWECYLRLDLHPFGWMCTQMVSNWTITVDYRRKTLFISFFCLLWLSFCIIKYIANYNEYGEIGQFNSKKMSFILV